MRAELYALAPFSPSLYFPHNFPKSFDVSASNAAPKHEHAKHKLPSPLLCSALSRVASPRRTLAGIRIVRPRRRPAKELDPASRSQDDPSSTPSPTDRERPRFRARRVAECERARDGDKRKSAGASYRRKGVDGCSWALGFLHPQVQLKHPHHKTFHKTKVSDEDEEKGFTRSASPRSRVCAPSFRSPSSCLLTLLFFLVWFCRSLHPSFRLSRFYRWVSDSSLSL